MRTSSGGVQGGFYMSIERIWLSVYKKKKKNYYTVATPISPCPLLRAYTPTMSACPLSACYLANLSHEIAADIEFSCQPISAPSPPRPLPQNTHVRPLFLVIFDTLLCKSYSLTIQKKCCNIHLLTRLSVGFLGEIDKNMFFCPLVSRIKNSGA